MKILVTAGPTREWLDPVRFLSNPASGRLGYLIAAKSAEMGDEVSLVSGPTNIEPPRGIDFHRVETAREMARVTRRLFPRVDCLFMTAAVSDWRPRFRKNKIKKKKGVKRNSILLYPNPDILAHCGRNKRPGQVIFGFALETSDFLEAAKEKMRRKNLDYILVNNPGFFGPDDGAHLSWLLTRSGKKTDLSDLSKEETARHIVNLVKKQAGDVRAGGR